MKDLFHGSLVRLTADQPETLAKSWAEWSKDSEEHRLANSSPLRLLSESRHREFVENNSENENVYRFAIHTLADDILIGSTSLWTKPWIHGEAWLGISIGDRNYWSKGYGTDAMQLTIGYGFNELNLRRISLSLNDYNERALKTYLKVGFQVEGRAREESIRDGVYYDGIYMGLLREEWKEKNDS